jgi:hypothetical protein
MGDPARKAAPEDHEVDPLEHADEWEQAIHRRIEDARAGRGGPALTLEELDAQTRAKFGWPA